MKTPQKGFTIIELLIATTVFSLVLLLATAGIMHVTKQYYQGVVQARVQETLRTVVDEIGESIRFSNADLSIPVSMPSQTQYGDGDPGRFGYFCMGAKRYSFVIDRQLKSGGSNETNRHSRHVLWVDQPSGASPCNSIADLNSSPPTTDGRELLSENMRLTKFSIMDAGVPSSGTYKIDVGIAYGDDDLLEPTTRKCKVEAGSEFCAYAEMSVIVTKRLN